MITFDREPGTYQHWRLTFDGPVATLTLDVNEDAGVEPGYKLKLNSYDLGVDIELRDALDRIRFEHPEVRAVVLTSGKERVFCAGANIYMPRRAARHRRPDPARRQAQGPARPRRCVLHHHQLALGA